MFYFPNQQLVNNNLNIPNIEHSHTSIGINCVIKYHCACIFNHIRAHYYSNYHVIISIKHLVPIYFLFVLLHHENRMVIIHVNLLYYHKIDGNFRHNHSQPLFESTAVYNTIDIESHYRVLSLRFRYSAYDLQLYLNISQVYLYIT